MKRPETESNPQPPVGTSGKPKVAKFQKVFNGRQQRVRGLWMRNGVFYGRFTATDVSGRKRDVFRPLESATTPAQAKEALHKAKADAAEQAIPVQGRSPKFHEYANRFVSEVSAHKAPATKDKEETQLGWWSERIGAMTLRQVHRVHIDSGIEALRKAGKSPRTRNLYVGTLRSVMKRALEQGLIHNLPTHGMRAERVTQRQREFIPLDVFTRVLEAAPSATKNAIQFCDYFRLLLYTGAREKETLRLRWADVDFKREILTIGADGLSKNRETRHIDFNPKLRQLLAEMETRRAPDSQWLFPSPQRGEKDIPAKSFRESLRLCCDKAGVTLTGFHDTRHFFISECVMAGIDFMTVARWVGHKDGGILIGKVYGHIGDQHRKRQAQRLNFDCDSDNLVEMPKAGAV